MILHDKNQIYIIKVKKEQGGESIPIRYLYVVTGPFSASFPPCNGHFEYEKKRKKTANKNELLGSFLLGRSKPGGKGGVGDGGLSFFERLLTSEHAI